MDTKEWNTDYFTWGFGDIGFIEKSIQKGRVIILKKNKKS